MVIARDGGRCRKCGAILHRARDCHVDHIVPKEPDAPAEATPLEGLQLLCSKCHGEKTQEENY
jgi:5-methylcytosine-specific restriction endonuclease McrA